MLKACGRSLSLFAMILVGACTVGMASAQDTVTNAGTLTCTTSDPGTDTSDAVELSCTFENQEGPGSALKGYIDRGGDAMLPGAGAVLIWTVKSETESFSLADLAGTYTGESGGEVAKLLRGGKDNSIVLEPVTDTSQIGGESQPTVLSLRLEATET